MTQPGGSGIGTAVIRALARATGELQEAIVLSEILADAHGYEGSPTAEQTRACLDRLIDTAIAASKAVEASSRVRGLG